MSRITLPGLEPTDEFGAFSHDAALGHGDIGFEPDAEYALQIDGYDLRKYGEYALSLSVNGTDFADFDEYGYNHIPVELGESYDLKVELPELPARTGVLSGTVKRGGVALTGARVYWYDNDYAYDEVWSGSVNVAANGTFSIPAYVGNEYELTVQMKDSWGDWDTIRTSLNGGTERSWHYVTASATGLNFTVPPSGTVAGTLTWPAGKLSTDKSYSYATLYEWDSFDEYWEYAGSAYVNSTNGAYKFNNVLPGKTYTVAAYTNTYSDSGLVGYATTFLGGYNKRIGPKKLTDVQTFTVANNQNVTGKNIALTRRDAGVKVNVTGFSAYSEPDITLYNLSTGNEDGIYVDTNASGAGNSTNGNVAPGQYYVRATGYSPAANKTRFADGFVTVTEGKIGTLNLAARDAASNFTSLRVKTKGNHRVGATVTASWKVESAPASAAAGASAKPYWSDGEKVISTGASAVSPAATHETAYPAVTVIAQKAGQVSLVGSAYHGTLDLGTAPRPTAMPSIKGKAIVGAKLTANPGNWTPKPARFAYQWLRGGKAIKGATKSTYVVTPADVKSRITVRVTPLLNGHEVAAQNSASTTKVSVASPKVTAKLSKKSVKKGKKAVVSVRVAAGSFKKVSGRVQVTFGKQKVTKKIKNGKVKVKSPKLKKKGKIKVKVTFLKTKGIKKGALKKPLTLRVK